MKKLNLFLTVLLAFALFMSSCVTTNKGYLSSPVISRNVDLDPIKADIVVKQEKIVGESTSAYFLMFRIVGDNTFADGITYSADANGGLLSGLNPLNGRLDKVKNAAAYKALSTGDYDILIHPVYTITTENNLLVKKYTVKVEGYGAKLTNFRTEKK